MEEKNIESKNEEVFEGANKNVPQENAVNNSINQETLVSPVLNAEIKNGNEVIYAGFWVRFLAVIVDGIIVSAASAILIMVTNGLAGDFYGSKFFGYVITWGYYIFMTDRYQATLGKKLLGLKVVSEDFTKLPLGNIILRETVGKIVSSIILLIGYIMVAFNKKKRALHDIIAGTLVVRNCK